MLEEGETCASTGIQKEEFLMAQNMEDLSIVKVLLLTYN